MKNLIQFLSMLALACTMTLLFSACDKEDIRPMVDISGTLTNTPDPAGGFNQVAMPDGSVLTFPKKYIVDGACSPMGDIVEAYSFLESINPAFDPRFGFKGDLNITLVDSKGDKLYFTGEFIMFQDFSNKSFLRIDGGTGRYEDAHGWFNATGQMNPENGVNVVVGAGKFTEPKKK